MSETSNEDSPTPVNDESGEESPSPKAVPGKRVLLWLAIALAVIGGGLIIAMLSSNGDGEADGDSIRLRVKSLASGKAIGSAQVFIGDKELQSDANGVCEIPSGATDVKVMAKGCIGLKLDLQGSSKELSVELPSLCALQLAFTSAQGAKIPFVEFNLESRTPRDKEDEKRWLLPDEAWKAKHDQWHQTGRDGIATIPNLLPNSSYTVQYRVTGSKTRESTLELGYQPKKADIAIGGDYWVAGQATFEEGEPAEGGKLIIFGHRLPPEQARPQSRQPNRFQNLLTGKNGSYCLNVDRCRTVEVFIETSRDGKHYRGTMLGDLTNGHKLGLLTFPDVILQPTRSYGGVLTEDGVPLEGPIIQISLPNQPLKAQALKDGRFEFKNVTSIDVSRLPNELYAIITTPGQPRRQVNVLDAFREMLESGDPMEIDLPPLEPTRLSISLAGGPGEGEATIYYSSSRARVPTVQSTASANGVVTLELVKGTYRLVAVHGDWVSDQTIIQIEGGGEESHILELKPGARLKLSYAEAGSDSATAHLYTDHGMFFGLPHLAALNPGVEEYENLSEELLRPTWVVPAGQGYRIKVDRKGSSGKVIEVEALEAGEQRTINLADAR